MFSKRQSSPYQPKIHLPIPFPRGSGSLQVQEIRSYKKEKKKRTLTNVLRDNHHPTNPRFTYQFYFQENPGVFKSKRSIPTKKNIKRTLTNVLKETTTTPPTQDLPTNSIFKRSSRSCKKERERTLMNVLRETHQPQTRKNSPISFISKRIQKSPSPRDPFLQKRTLTNVFKETIITLPTQDSLTDSLSKRVWESPSPRDLFL